MEEKQIEYIDLRKVFKNIIENKRKFHIVLPIVFVLACAYTLCIPRYYITEAKLVPEIENTGMGGTLGDLASSFGIDLSSMQTSDAISPLLYPDLMEDNGFVASLYDIHMKSDFDEDMPIDTTYYYYMTKLQKAPFWIKAANGIKKMFASESASKSGGSKYDPYYVSEVEDGIMQKIRDNISINIDKKTAVITITTRAQDPIICRTLADTLKSRLQEYITRYRTSKARVDMEYYANLMEQAKQSYDEARILYASKADSYRGNVLERVKTDLNNLENDMQLKYNNYSTIQTQYQAAVAKVQARTPVFTVLKEAVVPVKHAGPKRMLIVIGMLFLAFMATSAFVLWPDIKKQIDM